MANPGPPRAGRHRPGLPGRLLHRPVLRRHRGRLRVPALGSRRAEHAGAGRRVGVPVRRDRRGRRQPHRGGAGRAAGELPPPAVRPGPAARRNRPALGQVARHAHDERRERGLRPGPAGPAAQARRLLGLRPGRAGLLARRRGDRRADRLRDARHQRVRPGRDVPRGDPGADRQGPAGARTLRAALVGAAIALAATPFLPAGLPVLLALAAVLLLVRAPAATPQDGRQPAVARAGSAP